MKRDKINLCKYCKLAKNSNSISTPCNKCSGIDNINGKLIYYHEDKKVDCFLLKDLVKGGK